MPVEPPKTNPLPELAPMGHSLRSLRSLPSVRTLVTTVACGALALLAACSESPMGPGGAAEGGPVTVRPTAAAPSAIAATVRGCEGAQVALTADEQRLLELHDATRRSLGLPEYCLDATLTLAARAHSQEMLEKGYFSHDSFDGTNFGVRIRGFGFPSTRGLAENVAWGTGSMGEADDVFDRFMNSESHHHNIVDGSMRRIGVGVAAGTYVGRSGARMYTVDFGTL